MKIGIITFHDGINHGAFLQAFSTMTYLRSLDQNVKIINYKNPRHWFLEYKGLLVRKNPINIYNNVRNLFKFKRCHKRLPLTSFTLSSKKVSKEFFDLIIVGSDIIWNYQLSRLGQDRIYFGKDLNTNNIISYATSFGPLNENERLPDDIVQRLVKFNSITVRDGNSKRILSRNLGIDVEVVADPTLLNNFSGEENDCAYKDFILVYAFFLRESEIQAVKRLACEKGLKTIAIAYPQKWCSINVPFLSPFDWLGFFKNAEYIITSTFHGTIFSIKYGKQFITSNNDFIKDKTNDFLVQLGLASRISNGDINVEESLQIKINYDNVNKGLKNLITRSKIYINNAIDKASYSAT